MERSTISNGKANYSMVIFNSYVKLPEGIQYYILNILIVPFLVVSFQYIYITRGYFSWFPLEKLFPSAKSMPISPFQMKWPPLHGHRQRHWRSTGRRTWQHQASDPNPSGCFSKLYTCMYMCIYISIYSSSMYRTRR